jgi:hypothetical protein
VVAVELYADAVDFDRKAPIAFLFAEVTALRAIGCLVAGLGVMSADVELPQDVVC